MCLRSLSYCRISGTVRNNRGAPWGQASAAPSRGLRRADWRAGGGVVSHHPPVFQLDNAAPIGGISFRVCDLDDCCACIVQSLEKLHDLFTLGRMEISSRLISKD